MPSGSNWHTPDLQDVTFAEKITFKTQNTKITANSIVIIFIKLINFYI